MSITGADFLAASIRDRVSAAKMRVIQATETTANAIAKIDGAAEHAERFARQVESEADGLMAEIGQLSNMPPGDEPTEEGERRAKQLGVTAADYRRWERGEKVPGVVDAIEREAYESETK